MPLTVALNDEEVALLVEALQARAARHDSMARFNPRGAGPHDRRATAMRKLHARLAGLGTYRTGLRR
jgi:hypothetical protein